MRRKRIERARHFVRANDDVGRPSGGLRQIKFPDVVVFGAVDDNVVVGIADGKPGRGVSGSVA